MATTKTTKVFVGNLSFKTTQENLKNAFVEVGNVTNANIITRGTRSLGYGFVEFATEAEANKAVASMNKKSLDEREINVEIAKARDDSKPMMRSAPRDGFRGRRGGYRRGGGGGYRRGFRRPMNNFRRRRPPMRRPVNIEGRTQSTTSLFVANLPFNLDDDGLSKVFAGLSVKTAHVVRRPNGRSKGFGFVEFNSEDDQKKGLNGEKKVVEGRELVIKVALTEDNTKTESNTTATTKNAATTEKAKTPGTPTGTNAKKN